MGDSIQSIVDLVSDFCYFMIIPLPQTSNPFSGRMLLTCSSHFILCFSETCMPTSQWCSLSVLPLPAYPSPPSYRLLWIFTNLVLGQGSSQFSWPSCRLCMSEPQSFQIPICPSGSQAVLGGSLFIYHLRTVVELSCF